MQTAELESKVIGKPLLRVEEPRLVTGSGRFVDDVSAKGMLHASLLRSTFAHALIKSIDISRAAAVPGVVAILTGQDAVRLSKPLKQAFQSELEDYCLAPNEVVYVGQPVAAVVAESPYIASDAVNLIDIEYEPMGAAVDGRSAAQPSSPFSHSYLKDNIIFRKTFEYGDVEKVFAAADGTLSESLVFESYSATPLETFAIIADYNKQTGFLTVTDNCQAPMRSVATISEALSIPSNKIRMIQNDIGGGFGVKIYLTQYETLLAMLAMRVGGAVKWVETRSEHLLASSHSSRRQYDVKVAYKRDGKLLGLRVSAFEDAGGFARRPFTAPVSCLRAFGGPYRIEAFDYDLTVVLTNKCPSGASRGNGKNHHAFLLEKVMDHVAAELGISPYQIRMKNLIQPEEFPYVSPNGSVYDSGRYPDAMKRASELIGLRDFPSESQDHRRAGSHVGLGFAMVVDAAASNSFQESLYDPKAQKWGTTEMAQVRMDQFGNVLATVGSVPQGQGHETVAAMLVADTLGLGMDRITVTTGFDSLRAVGTPDSGTYSSRFSAIAASAVVLAADDLRQKLLSAASKIAKKPVESLHIEEGVIVSSDTETRLEVSEVARQVYSGLPGTIPVEDRVLQSVATYCHPFGRTLHESYTNLASTYSYQVHAAKVEVDVETGRVKVLSYVIVDDSGRTLNPIILEGQVHGGVLNGIAAALHERYLYDDDGQLLTATFADYSPPTAAEMIDLEVDLMETPSPFTLTGAKGVGETGALGPQPAIMNAIEDALREYMVRLHSSFVTSEDILSQIKNGQTRQRRQPPGPGS